MKNEPYRPGGEHCRKCGYRHDGRCNEKHREFARWFAQKFEGTFDSRCQSDGDIARAYEARQPEIDNLREFARLLYGHITHGGEFEDELPDSVKRVARKLGIVRGGSMSTPVMRYVVAPAPGKGVWGVWDTLRWHWSGLSLYRSDRGLVEAQVNALNGEHQDARQAHGVEPARDSAATQALKARAEHHCHEDE